MSFWQRIKDGFRKFMEGRHGADQLSQAIVWTCLILYIVAMLTGWTILWLVSMVGLGYSLFRMFSRNNEKRWAENNKYLEIFGSARVQIKQAFARLKNSQKFKYFRCPKCKSWLRLPRKVGEVTITCGKCGHAFKKKA